MYTASLGHKSVSKTEKNKREDKRKKEGKGEERGRRREEMVMCNNVAYKSRSSVTKYIQIKFVAGICFSINSVSLKFLTSLF